MSYVERLKLGISTIEYQVQIGRDGNKWVALLGPDLQQGIAGFGDTIGESLINLGLAIDKS